MTIATPVATIVRLAALPDQSALLGQTLIALAEASRSEPGCAVYDVYRAPDDIWIIVEVWRDAAAMEAHLAAPHTQAALALFSQALRDAPEVTSCAPASIAGPL